MLVANASASATRAALASLASDVVFSSSVKYLRRSRSNVERAWLKRFQSESSVCLSMRGPLRCASFH